MARQESQHFWLNSNSFNGGGSVGPDEEFSLVTFEPPSSSQFSLDLAFDVEQYELPIQDSHSCFGPVFAQPDGMYGTTLPSPIDNTHFPNPVENYTAELGDGMDSSIANTCGAAAQILKTGYFTAEKMKDIPMASANIIVDSNAIKLCEYWLQLYSNVYPKDADINALSQLTGQPPASIERWLNNKMRSVPSSSHDSGIGSSKSSTVSSVISLETSAPGDATLTEMAPPQIRYGDLNNSASNCDPVFIELDSTSRLVFEIPETWITSPLVKGRLAEAAWSLRARSSCRPTSSIAKLKRNPNKPLQCTQKCGYATAPKKDWKRHEENAFPQHGFLCTLPAAIKIGNDTFCVYCPAELRQLNPTIAHMKSEHRLTLSADCDLEMTLCNQVCHRREHLKNHFSTIHPGIHPDAWVGIAAFDVKQSVFPKYCGFCRKTFTSWNERIDHIQVHFESDGLDMRKWQDFGDSDDHRPNKRHRRDDDADDRSDSGDSDQGDDGHFGKGSSGTGNRSNGKRHNTRTQQLRGDRSLQTPSHYHGTSSSGGDTASEDEHVPALNHVYVWLEDVSMPEESTSAQETLDGDAHLSELHLDESGHDVLSYDEAIQKQVQLTQRNFLAAGGSFDSLSGLVGVVMLAMEFIRFYRHFICSKDEIARAALLVADPSSSFKKIRQLPRESQSIMQATVTALDRSTLGLRRLLACEGTIASVSLKSTGETSASRVKGIPRTLENFNVLSPPSAGTTLHAPFRPASHVCRKSHHGDHQLGKGYHSRLKVTHDHSRKTLSNRSLGTSRRQYIADTRSVITFPMFRDAGDCISDVTTCQCNHSFELGLGKLLSTGHSGRHASDNVMIVVMGVTGVGKSTWISRIYGATPDSVDNCIALRDEPKFYLADSPGLDNIYFPGSDEEKLHRIVGSLGCFHQNIPPSAMTHTPSEIDELATIAVALTPHRFRCMDLTLCVFEKLRLIRVAKGTLCRAMVGGPRPFRIADLRRHYLRPARPPFFDPICQPPLRILFHCPECQPLLRNLLLYMSKLGCSEWHDVDGHDN